VGLGIVAIFFLAIIGVDVASGDLPAGARVWRFLAVAAVPYTLVGAPFLATQLRRLISHEREFLADADAVLLTRDPDGLPSPWAKVGRAGRGVRAGAATAHLYFVDPLPVSTSWWDTLYSPHPPIAERIDHVATMGDGVPAAELEAAERIGQEYGDRLYVRESRKQLPAEVEQAPRLADQAGTPLVAQLPDNEALPRGRGPSGRV